MDSESGTVQARDRRKQAENHFRVAELKAGSRKGKGRTKAVKAWIGGYATYGLKEVAHPNLCTR